MPAPLTPCITLAAIGTAVGPLPSAGRSSKGRVGVSQQINALLVDRSAPAGPEPGVQRGVAQIGGRCDTYSGGLTQGSAIHTFNLPDSGGMLWRKKGFDRSQTGAE